MQSAAATVEQYLQELPAERKLPMQQLHKIIKKIFQKDLRKK